MAKSSTSNAGIIIVLIGAIFLLDAGVIKENDGGGGMGGDDKWLSMKRLLALLGTKGGEYDDGES